MRIRNTRACLALLTLVCCFGGCDGDPVDGPDARLVLADEVRGERDTATDRRGREALVEVARFEARFDPQSSGFAFDVAPIDGALAHTGRSLDNDELEPLRVAEQALYCPALVGRRPGTISMSADAASFGNTPAACGLPNEMPYTTLGVICSDVTLTAVGNDFGEVFAEITQISPSVGYAGYNHPFGNGVPPEHLPLGSTAPSDQSGGLWRYENVDEGVPREAQWVLENAGGVFTLRGRLVARVFETEDGVDEDCDGVIDNGLNLFEGGAACEFGNDCVSGVCVDGACQEGECAIDSDEDGVFNCFETCVDDPNKTEPGICGCGLSDVDSDGDDVADCNDLCPEDLFKVAPGECGCNFADTDSDEDGTANCNDECPDDPAKTEPGTCGCGTPEGCSICGNGAIEVGEDCDDAGESATCNVDCTVAACGDGRTNTSAGETCDEAGDTGTCDADCTAASCGDGFVNSAADEFCDDGNATDTDDCSNACLANRCGDGVVQLDAGETCDDGNAIDGDGCSNTCQSACGDGVTAGSVVTSLSLVMHVDAVQDGSQFSVLIDDYVALAMPLQDTPANTIDGQAPIRTFAINDARALALLNSGPRTITIRMGAWRFGNAAFYVDWVQLVINGSAVTLYDANGNAGSSATAYAYDPANFIEVLRYNYSVESCDDGNTVSGDGCSAECLAEGCGNGAIDAGEACDDGNTTNADGCSSTCALENCGNGAIDLYEECDDNNGDDTDGCTSLCKVPRCGNGIVEAAESCDDANLIAGDGCSASCGMEACGNGVLDVGESCDGGGACTGTCAYASCLSATDSDGDGLLDCVETNTGIFVNLSNTGTDPFDADTDDDGISDGVELLVQPTGLNLRALGANPLRKTVFVEADWTNAPTCADLDDFQPTDWEIAIAREMFADAPVSNRDGSRGIDLIIDYGQGGVFSGGNNLGDDSNLESGLAGDFLVYKANNLATERAPYFRYAVLTATQNNGAGGLGETPGNDFNVTQGCIGPSVARIGAFLHELGHNLGLLHGGDDNCNFEPNYNSTMNYGSTGLDTNCDGIDDALPDFSSGTHINIDEANINEFAGLCGTNSIDFNGSGTIESGYSANLNAHSNETAFCGSTLSVLDDHDDWGNLFFGGLGTSGDSAVAPSITICPPARPQAPLSP